MKRIVIIPTLVILLVELGSLALGTTYYVSSSGGSDANSGTSSATAWQTLGKVNGQTFLPGDQVLLRRGDVWNESLIPPSSGSSGNPIAFDAYGTGAPPNLTGYHAVPSSAWVLVSGNAWKAPLPATYSTINFCLFGTVWGQKVAALAANLTAQWDFYFANGYVYVYSGTGNPASYYNNAPIVPMALSNVPVVNINGKSWLTFQHLLVNWFDQYGVYVQGTSDHLVFANMEADSMIPQGTQPLGFYVNESAQPADIKIYNSEAHLNYDGFRVDGFTFNGVGTPPIAMVNDKAYGNRDGALVDNSGNVDTTCTSSGCTDGGASMGPGAVTYSHCHFYASSLAVANSTDVEFTQYSLGPAPGPGNVPADTPPAVQAYQRYPAQVTLTVDDVGMTAGADTYYEHTVLPIAVAAGVPVGTAITVGYTAAMTPAQVAALITEIQGWINAGRDVTSHSMSHTYYTNTDALDIQYTGSGTAASLSISGKTLTITVTGASDSVSYNLAQGQPQGTIQGLRTALFATGKFSWVEPTPCQGPYGTGCSAFTEAALLAQDLADVSGQDVKSAVYHMQLDVTRLTTDEITLSRQWMTTNLTGLPPTPVYVYPGGYETTAMQGITAGVPYSGARGALKEDLGVKDTYASGFDVQNVTSFGVNPSWMGLAPAALNQKIQALVWKQMVWGVPWGVFWHLNELTDIDPVGGTEITNLIQDFKASGATIQTNTGLVHWLLGGTQETGTDGNAYYKFPATSMTLDFRPTANSPVVDAGQNLGAAYQIDINGVNQNNNGSAWEIGAHAFIGYSTYGDNGGGSFFTVGEGLQGPGAVQLPQNWVNENEPWGTTTNTIYFPAAGSGGSWTCGTTNYGPYAANNQSSLGQAVADAESCRASNGSGTMVVVPHGSLFSGPGGIALPQTAGDTSTNFIVLTSDTPLPTGQTACSHGTQDVTSESIAPGYRNFGCNGQKVSYQLATAVTPVAANRNIFTLGGSQGSAANILLTLPTWSAGKTYYGVSGAKRHSDWVQNSCGDGSGILYVYENLAGDIASASVAPTACAFSGTTSDGSGTWQNNKAGSFPITGIQEDGSNDLIITTSATVNGAAGVAINDTLFLSGVTTASFVNNTALTVTAVSAHTVTATGVTHGAYGPASDTGTVWDTSHYNNFVSDEYFLRLVANFSGAKLELSQTVADTGTTGPSISFAGFDATLSGYNNDVNWNSGITPKYLAFDVSHQNNSSGSSSVNSATPAYVALATYAGAQKTNWTAGTTYLYHQYICDDGLCNGSGHWQQFIGKGVNAVYLSSGAAPSWNHSGGVSTDGACNNCWQDMGTGQAPLQEFVTCSGATGDGKMSALGFGVWTLTTAQAIDSTITSSDLVSAFPVIWGVPYQTASLNFDDAVASHYGSSPWGPAALAFIHYGESLNGQSMPVCGATLQGAGYANTGTGTSWVNLWTGAVKQFYLHRANEAAALGLPEFFTLVSPQSGSNPTDPGDPTGLSNSEADYAYSLDLATGYAGLTANDVNVYPGHLNADWGRNATQDCASLGTNCYTEMLGPGHCDNTVSPGRLDVVLGFVQEFTTKRFGVYGNDFWRTDPNQVEYGTCGSSFLTAIQAFQRSNYNDLASMWTLECTGAGCSALSGSGWDSNNVGPHHYAILNAEFRPQAGSGGGAAPVALGTGSVTLQSQLPSHIHLAYDYAHGDWADGVCTANCGTSTPTYAAPLGHTSIPNDYVLSCIYCSLTYSYADQSLRPGAEGHGIYCLYCQQLKLVHNWIEGNSTHGLFCGGQTSNLAITSFVGCTDVEDRANRYTYPWTWMLAYASGNNPAGGSYVNKNGGELKNGVRVLRDGNVYENVDLSGGQGNGVTAKVAQCSSGNLCSNYFLTTSNVSMTDNVVRNACYGTGFGDGGNTTDGGGVSLGVNRVNFANNLLYNIGSTVPGCPAGSLTPTNGHVIGPGSGTMTWTGCTGVSDIAGNETVTCTAIPGGGQLDFVPGDHIAVSLCSDATFDAGFSGGIGPTVAPTTVPTSLSITFLNPGVTLSGSATGCKVWKGQGKPEYVTIAHNTAVGVANSSGSPVLAASSGIAGTPVDFVWNATVQNNIFVSNWTNLAQAGGINGDPAEGTRTEVNLFDANTLTLNNNVIQGRGLYGLMNCNGANPDVCSLVSGDNCGDSSMYSRVPTGNIVLNGTYYAVNATTGVCKVTLTSTGPTGNVNYFWADYTDYGGVHDGTQPSIANYFPVEPCSVGTNPGAESTVGFAGVAGLGAGCALVAGTSGTWTGFPTALADWHGYRLCHAGDASCSATASPFAGGQANQATDGTDEGASLTAIDAAETSTRYQCVGPCGSGPMRDVVPQIQILAPGAGTSVPAVNGYLKASPYINGIVYSLYWSCADQDGTSAHYTWTNFDNQVISDGWAAAGKKIIVVLGGVTYGGSDSVCYGGGGFGTGGIGNYGTPAYVWTGLGSSNYVSCTASGQAQQIPNYLNSAYSTNYRNWIQATLTHLASSAYAGSIQYVRVAWGKGGETTPTANWDQAGMCPDGQGNNTLTTDWGYTLAGWENFLNQGMTFEAALNSGLQLMIGISPMGASGGSQNVVPDFAAPIAASLHIGLGTLGLAQADVNNCAGSMGDWCNLFNTYKGQVPLETQTLSNSCAALNMSGSCSSLANVTGPLDPLLLWAARNHGTTFEMYYEDALAMFEPAYNLAGYAAFPQAGYVAAVQEVVSGNF